jgi:quercetin dioxygenase-like cupin family protein
VNRAGAQESPDVTVKRLDELEWFFHGAFGRLRAGLGLRAFGMQVVRLEPHSGVYPEHDHTDNDQEEVYVTLSGKATLSVGNEQYILEPGVFVRVGPDETRKVVTGEDPVELVVVGGAPGRAYTPPPYTESGAALAVAEASPTSVRTGDDVTFDGSGSSAGSGTNELSYAWDLEGSGSYVQTEATFTHAYEEAGTYTATLRITDGAGRTDTDKVRIHVQP